MKKSADSYRYTYKDVERRERQASREAVAKFTLSLIDAGHLRGARESHETMVRMMKEQGVDWDKIAIASAPAKIRRMLQTKPRSK